jgi:hypothetical protein
MREGFRRHDADVSELRSAIGSQQNLLIGFVATTLDSIVGGVVLLFLTQP